MIASKAGQYLDRIENNRISTPTYSRQEVIKFAELYAEYVVKNLDKFKINKQ